MVGARPVLPFAASDLLEDRRVLFVNIASRMLALLTDRMELGRDMRTAGRKIAQVEPWYCRAARAISHNI
jgi:hypothetical protein